MINGTEYAYEDVEISLLSRSLQGAVSISYGVNRAYTNIRARGNRPIKRGRGAKDAEPVNLVILQSELEAMQASMPPGTDLTDLAPFTITVKYGPVLGNVVRDILPYCQISRVVKATGRDDDHMEASLEIISDIPLFNQ